MYVYTKKKTKVLGVGKQIANVTINCKRKKAKKKITQERQSKGLERHLFVKLSALKYTYSVYVQPE